MNRSLCILTLALACAVSQAQTYTPPTPAGDMIKLAWSHADPQVAFRLYLGTKADTYTRRFDLPAGARTMDIPDLDPLATYYIRLTAVIGQTEGPPSPEWVSSPTDTQTPFPLPPGWESGVRIKTLTVSSSEELTRNK